MRRTWRKLYLGVDSETGEVTAVIPTDNTSGDALQLESLLEETLSGSLEASDPDASNVGTTLDTVGEDGAYDTSKVYDVIEDYGGTPVIPPQRNAKIEEHGKCFGPPLPRDEAIRYFRGHGGCKKWKRV